MYMYQPISILLHPPGGFDVLIMPALGITAPK